MGLLLSAAAKVTRGVGLGRLVDYARRRRDDPNPYRTPRGPAVHLGAPNLDAVDSIVVIHKRPVGPLPASQHL